MGLIPIYFTIADFYEIDNTASLPFLAGTLVSLTTGSDGNAQVTQATTSSIVIGIAGDSYKSDVATHPSGYAADITVGAYGGSVVRSQNKINDLYKETLGSGRMTVYTVGGKFGTDQLSTGANFVVGAKVYSDANGKLASSGSISAGYCVGTPSATDNGVPGTDTPDNSMSLGTYMTFVLAPGI